MNINSDFFLGKRVFVTGHTGFKGTWLCKMLINMGAEVCGYSLAPVTKDSLFGMCDISDNMCSVIGDIRDYKHLKDVFNEFSPEIVIHLAAQPIVRTSYKDPRYTYETNVMGTVNLLECVRNSNGNVKSVLNVTTDKVYYNNEWVWGYRENEQLDGFDPYSNSKSCSELITHSYWRSFFDENNISLSTARAGNVIGGGDFSEDRIIPDCVRAVSYNKEIIVRNPNSIRPYQHVLEPLLAYLMITEKQYECNKYAGWYNVGPNEEDCITTGNLVSLFCKHWGEGASWRVESEKNAPHEANFLKLDCSKIKSVFGWKPKWTIDTAVEKTVEWSKEWLNKGNINRIMDEQIDNFIRGGNISGV